MTDLHEAMACGPLALVELHVAGGVWTSISHRENLVAAMITGREHPIEAPPASAGGAFYL